MPWASFQELLPRNRKTHLLPSGQIMTTCHLPEKLVRDSVSRVLTGAGPVGTSLSLVLQGQTPRRKAGAQYEPEGFGTRGHSRQVGGGGTHVPSAAEASLVSIPFQAEQLRLAMLTPFCPLSYTHVLFLNGIIFSYCRNGVCALLEKCIKCRLQKEEI